MQADVLHCHESISPDRLTGDGVVYENEPAAERQVGRCSSEIFASFVGINPLNNLAFDKLKWKTARAASHRGRERPSCGEQGIVQKGERHGARLM